MLFVFIRKERDSLTATGRELSHIVIWKMEMQTNEQHSRSDYKCHRTTMTKIQNNMLSLLTENHSRVNKNYKL